MPIIPPTGGNVITGGVQIPFQDVSGGQIISGGRVIEGSTTKASRRGFSLTDLMAAYHLDETSGTRNDLLGLSPLTATGSVTNAAGKLGNAASFSSGNYLSAPDSTQLSTGDIDFSISAWVYLTDKTANRCAACKFGTGGGNEWTLEYRVTEDRFAFFWNGTTLAQVYANTFGPPALNTWYHLRAGRNKTTGKAFIAVNNGPLDEVTATGGTDSTSLLQIGARGGAGTPWIGRVQLVYLFRRMLTAAEWSVLYNSGNGYALSTPYTSASFTYASLADPGITNLAAKCTYPTGAINLPIVLLMHGYNGDITNFSTDTMQRIAAYGLFVCAVAMRERNESGGSKDTSAREIFDILDALDYVRTTFASAVSQTYASVVGYSGGGGNAFACAAKAPDTFTDIVSHFGISDYGVDATYGWWQQNPTYRTGTNNLEDTIGGTPVAVPDAYAARDHRRCAGNFSGGKAWIFHDRDDASVPISQSQRFVAAMAAAGLSNYATYYSGAPGNVDGYSSSPRWHHGYPEANDQPSLMQSEPIWATAIAAKTNAPWTAPVSGTLQVAGYVRTKRFRFALGDGTAEAGTLVYDMTTRTFTITTATGSSTYTLRLYGQTPNASIAATINGGGTSATSDGTGTVTYSGNV